MFSDDLGHVVRRIADVVNNDALLLTGLFDFSASLLLASTTGLILGAEDILLELVHFEGVCVSVRDF